MTHSGDAAEQIVRMSLEGVEVAARITGAAAKEVAMFIIAALKSKEGSLKLKGKARLASMLKSGKALEIFSVKEGDLEGFMQGAKRYGIVYCVLRSKARDADGICDILVKADDAPKISRVIERFKFTTVDKARIESEIVSSKAQRGQEAQAPGAGEGQAAPDKDDTEKLLDGFLGTPEGKAAPEAPKEARTGPGATKAAPAKEAPRNPGPARAAKPRPSAPTSESKSEYARATSSRPSVREELREITAARRPKQEADAPKQGRRAPAGKPKGNPPAAHRQPATASRPRTRKPKER